MRRNLVYRVKRGRNFIEVRCKLPYPLLPRRTTQTSGPLITRAERSTSKYECQLGESKFRMPDSDRCESELQFDWMRVLAYAKHSAASHVGWYTSNPAEA